MADRDDKDWRFRDINRRPPPDSHADDVESEEDFDDDYDDFDDDHENDDIEDDGEKTGLACPFCLEDFDVLGLCCHIDVEHHWEAKAAICPVCASNVETNIVAHLLTLHKTILKMLCKKKIRRGGSRSALLIFKKESQDERFRSHLKESSSVDSSSNMEPDALLLSFIYNPQPLQKPEITRPSSEAGLVRSNSHNDSIESDRDIQNCALPNKDQERVQRGEFVRGLLFSTIFNDNL